MSLGKAEFGFDWKGYCPRLALQARAEVWVLRSRGKASSVVIGRAFEFGLRRR